MLLLDYFVVGLYFILILGIGVYTSKNKDNTSEYFLANRNLGWFVIGASLFASNIGSEHLVGLAESGFKKGLIESQFEILAAFMLLILGWVFVPFYKRSGVVTMPEFLERRFSSSARMYLSLVSIFAYVITKISVTIFAGAIVFESLLGIDFWTGAIIVVVVTGLYTVLGGLKAVIYTDTIQMFLLLGGSILVTIFGLDAIGGWGNMVATSGEGFMSLWRTASDPDYPWTAILFGAPILGVWYWCTDQFIVQRVLAAQNVSVARKATIFAAFLKLTPMFIFVIPGMIAYTLNNDPNSGFILENSAGTLPEMVKFLLPAGLRGLVAAGILSALMSSLSSVFNSCSTLITLDIYKKYNPEESEKKLVLVGQIATGFLVLSGMLWIPFQKTLASGGLFGYLQKIQAYISPPIAAVFLLGLFIKRINSKGAMAALYTGAILGATRLICEIQEDTNILTQSQFLHFALYLFIICAVIMLVVSYMTEEPDYNKIKDVTYNYSTSSDENSKDLIVDKILTGLIIFSVLIIWYIFS